MNLFLTLSSLRYFLFLLGGQEERFAKDVDQSTSQEPETADTETLPTSARTKNHAYVPTMRRNKSAIRTEIKESASNFLQVRIMKGIYFYCQIFLKFIFSQSTIYQSETLPLTFINYNKRSNNILFFLKARLNDEQSYLVKSIISLTTAETAAEFISASLPLLATCDVPQSEMQPFIDSVLENFDEMKPKEDIAMKDYGVRLYFMLRESKEPVTGFLSGFIVLSPHSMTVEKCVSTYNMLFSDLRTSSSEGTLVNR